MTEKTAEMGMEDKTCGDRVGIGTMLWERGGMETSSCPRAALYFWLELL